MNTLNFVQVMSPTTNDQKEKWPIYKSDQFGVWRKLMKEKLQEMQCGEVVESSYLINAQLEFEKTTAAWIMVGEKDDFGHTWRVSKDGIDEPEMAERESSGSTTERLPDL